MQTQSNLHSVVLQLSLSSQWVSSVPLDVAGILCRHSTVKTQHKVGFHCFVYTDIKGLQTIYAVRQNKHHIDVVIQLCE